MATIIEPRPRPAGSDDHSKLERLVRRPTRRQAEADRNSGTSATAAATGRGSGTRCHFQAPDCSSRMECRHPAHRERSEGDQTFPCAGSAPAPVHDSADGIRARFPNCSRSCSARACRTGIWRLGGLARCRVGPLLGTQNSHRFGAGPRLVPFHATGVSRAATSAARCPTRATIATRTPAATGAERGSAAYGPAAAASGAHA